MTRNRSIWAALAVIVVLVVAEPGWAAFRAKVSATTSGTVIVNGQAAMRFQTTNGSLSPAQRANIVADRLRQLVAGGVSPYLLFAKGTKYQAKIYAGETLLCIVTRLDARQARTSPLALAGAWASNTRALLLMPPVVLSDNQLLVPLGENRSVFITGAATGPIYAKSDQADTVTATPATDGRYVQVTGQQVGQATVAISVEGEIVTLPVSVRRYAGSIPARLFAEVTGSPCPGSLVAYAAAQAVLRNAQTEPGAEIKIEGVEGAKNALSAGLTRDAKISVAISGAGYIDYRATTSVEVHDSVMPREQVRELFYSNNPERLLKYQTLFAGKIEIGKSTRILYHHQNAIGKRTNLVVEVVNSSNMPATYRVFRGISKPMVDTVQVGYVASTAFMKDQFYNASVIERVPAQSRLILVSDMLDNMDTASGVLEIKQTDGQGAHVRVAALPPDLENVKVGQVLAAPSVIDLPMSEHVYPTPTKTVEAGYIVGQRWAFISIGRHAIDSNDAQRKLDGNYGVTYDINVKVENPTDVEKKVSVLFEPSAGLASGIFLIDGSFVSAKYAKPPAEVPLVSYKLKPGEVRNVRIETLPVAGSNYPATLVVRS